MTIQFSVLLRQLRQQAGLTQEELADRAGLSVRTIRRLETGVSANPQLDTVRLLADALGLQPDERARLLAVADGQVPSEPAGTEEVRPESPFERRLAEAADDLAHAVGARLGREEELRRIQDPFPLPVRWDLAPDGVMDHWENICRSAPGESAAPLDLVGRLPDIAHVYRRIPSRRLVVLGRAGSGKSVLAVRFVLDLLRTRVRGDAVPVVFSLGSWDPTATGFRDWLAGQLVRDHPGLAAAEGDKSNLATALVEAGRVVPVLDGFDELAAGLHRTALDALNDTTLPLLLTSRPGEYAAVAGTDPLTAAAAVRLIDLTVADLVDYLPRTTRKDSGATAWDPVLNELHDHPGRPASGNLRAVLTTPLMVGLARAIYSDPAGRDPAELLDTGRFGSQYALEDHLLGSFIPTVYRDRQPRWERERVRGWLSYLARHLDKLDTSDLAWWQLGSSMRRRSRMAVVGLLAGLVVGVLTGSMISLVGALAGGPVMLGLVAAVGNWLGFGLALGLAHGAGITFGGGAFEPSRVRLRTRGGSRQLRRRFVPRLLIGVVGGAGLGVVLGLACVARLDPMGLFGFGFFGGFAAGAGFGALVGLTWGLMAGLEAPVDLRSVVGPADLLRTNRSTVVAGFAGCGLVLAVAHLLVITVALDYVWPAAVLLDLVLGPVIGLVIGLCLTAWGQWVVFARVWLPLTGRLPWHVAEFLEDACRRGVLRQVGAVYQFRHARLHAHLLDVG
ncbi:helix-turn-helix domain-containing protein [Actinophytocola algeriensis]|uniref:Transcriptional regulator with XRE-family HTH domain n=1 Tax=Actinophytocola algeriensis TaxID=1768010 RepID=A0A7W7VIR4_9PSEU|nr:helix-turn-helix domain-containing protein [Actinophytocola algeriensis]MBB4911728.1 transcriptional regulator with XRE-family HTH domain [Actinophytocola algeriensis]MBE1473284.1 transcriptional regulator with XRE-family HTH domain [Actinophytocola algeriensis]